MAEHKSTRLQPPKSGIIRKIIQLSDLHIKNGDVNKSRYNEYLQVFNNLCDMIHQIPNIHTESVIIITGDIFDIKNRVESCAIDLFFKLLKMLSSIAPVYLIQGNHDYRQDETDTPDILSSLLQNNQDPNITYLHKTGTYVVGDVGFGLVSVNDTLQKGNTHGKVDTLPPFPKDFPTSVQTKIALFHGDVRNSTLQNYTSHQTGYPIEWFDGFHLGLFGDIHLQQVHNATSIRYDDNTGKETFAFANDKITWAYPGSLVQSNFGEPLIGHGFLLWDLQNKTVTTNHVYNKYGMIYLKYLHDQWQVAYHNNWVKFTPENPIMPTNMLIKFKGKCAHDNIDSLQSLLSSTKKVEKYLLKYDLTAAETTADETQSVDPETIIKENMAISSFNTPDVWIKYVSENKYNSSLLDKQHFDWRNWLKDHLTIALPDSLTIDLLKKRAMERNAKIAKLGQIVHDNISQHSIRQHKSKLCLKHVKWQWLLCYRDGNWFDFNSMMRNICIVNGKNDSGKSSFFEIICIALFGKQIPTREAYKGSIICYQKPPTEKPQTQITFSIGEHTYQITRIFDTMTGTSSLRTREANLFTIEPSGLKHIHSGVDTVDTWIKQYIGTVASFLMSCMITQKTDMDLLQMESKKQIPLFDQALNLECIKSLKAFLHEAYNAYTDIIDKTDTVYRHAMESQTYVDANDVTKLRLQYDQSIRTMKDMESQYDAIPETWHKFDHMDFNKPVQDIEQLIKSDEKVITELSHYDRYASQIDSLKEEKVRLTTELMSLYKVYCPQNDYRILKAN